MRLSNINNLIQTAANSQQDKKRLKEACQDFEAMFLNNLMKSMRKTVSKSDLFGSDKGEELFQDMMDTEVCNKAAKTGSMGMADLLYKQISAQMDTGSKTGSDNATKNTARGENR